MSKPPKTPPRYIHDPNIFPPPQPRPPPKSQEQIFEESQRFVDSSINKKFLSFYTYPDLPESQYPPYQNIPENVRNNKSRGDYESIKKYISFGTDIIGIILNPKLLKSDNIFEDPEILKYRMFSSYKNMYNYITKNTENIEDIYNEWQEEEYYKNKILNLYKKDDDATKIKKLMEISKSYDDSYCSILSCGDGISCPYVYPINNLLDYYGKNFNVQRQETEINLKRQKSHVLFNSFRDGNGNEFGDEILFYKYLYDVLKNNVERKFDSKKISKTIQDNKTKINSLFLYYKPICSYDKFDNPTIIEINHCMKQYENLISDYKDSENGQEDHFYFHGCYELKDDDYGKPEFMADFEDLKSIGQRYIGYIFVCPFAYSNVPSDLYYQYITLYIDIEPDKNPNHKYNIYYFEPSKFPIRNSILKFVNYLCTYNKIQPKEINLIFNKKPISNKFIYLNNAIYAIIALIALAYGINFQQFCNLPIYNKFLNQIKQIMFIDKSKLGL